MTTHGRHRGAGAGYERAARPLRHAESPISQAGARRTATQLQFATFTDPARRPVLSHDEGVAVLVGFIFLGFGAYDFRWLWPVAVLSVLALVAWNWISDAYSDSGNAIGFSILLLVWFGAPVLIGAAVGRVAEMLFRDRGLSQ